MLLRTVALALVVTCGSALAAEAPEANAPAPSASPLTVELNVLFDHLKHARSQPEADAIEARIVELWGQSPSDTANLLYARGLEAMENDKELALEIFTAVTELQPDFAEAWQELGAVNFALDAHDAAVVDLEHALQIEPRHYGALLGLASIFEAYGNKKAALDVLRRADAIDPFIPDIEQRIHALSLDVEGQRI